MIETIQKLGKYYGKNLNAEQSSFFLEELSGYSDTQIELAVGIYKKDFNNSRMPLPSQIAFILQTSGVKSDAEYSAVSYRIECEEAWKQNRSKCAKCGDLGLNYATKNSEKIKYNYTFRCHCKMSNKFSSLIPQWRYNLTTEYTLK